MLINIRLGVLDEMISVGSPIPDFELIDQNGQRLASTDLVGTKSVLYFYPKDFTPGCTTQADEFSVNYPKFKKNGIRVIGLSPDDDASHKKFCAKMNIPYTLLADTEHRVAEKFGVWGLKKFMGRQYMGVNRTTFLLDDAGTIVRIFEKVKPTGHANMVLEFFENL